MMRRITEGSVPTLLLLQYTAQYDVSHLQAVHRAFMTPEVIQERKPLSASARRAGWIGCNILITAIPPEGRISLVVHGVGVEREAARATFQATSKLSGRPLAVRGWSAALLRCLHKLTLARFSLQEVYRFEGELAAIYPHNANVRAKIRQQLQILRDAGLIAFEGRGRYRLVF